MGVAARTARRPAILPQRLGIPAEVETPAGGLPPVHQLLDDLVEVRPAVVAYPLRRLDLLPRVVVEAVPVMRVGMSLTYVGVGIVVPEDRAVTLTDDAGVVAVVESPYVSVRVDFQLLLHIDEQFVATGEASDDKEVTLVSVDVREVGLDDLPERDQVVEVAEVDFEIRLRSGPTVPITQRRGPSLAGASGHPSTNRKPLRSHAAHGGRWPRELRSRSCRI